MEGRVGEVAEKRLYDAAARGDARALHELLEQDPLLLDRVSFTCSKKTPLHIAAMQGHLAIVQEILNRNPQLAEELDSQQSSALHIASAKGYVEIASELLSAAPDMCLSRDCQGRNPLHLAAMRGRVQVLAGLVRMAPLAAQEKLDGGQTVLHLCVKHYQLEALKILVPNLSELVCAKDDDGNTVLHLAGLCTSNNTQTQPVKWLTKKRDAIMVVAILIATMAFQAGVSPAGGVWQDDLTQDSQGNPVPYPHRAGEAVMAYNHPKVYKNFLRSNTVAFVSSLSTILLLIGGLPFRRRLFMWVLMVTMWLAVTSIAVSYAASILVVTPRTDREPLSHVIGTGITVWCSVMGILLVGNTLRLIDRWLKSKGVTVWRPIRFRKFVEVKHENANPEGV